MLRQITLLGQITRLGVTAAAILAAGLTQIAPAQAGGGVKLEFGGPLGTFTARPSPGGGDSGGSGYGQHKPSKPKATQKKPQRPSASTAARHKAKPNRNVAKTTIRENREPPSKTAARPQEPREPRVVSRGTVEDTAADKATDTVTPASGTRSLAAGALPRSEPIAATGKPDESITAVDAPESDQTELAPPASQADTPKVETAGVKTEECKKFIPAVGVTVTVGCNE